MNSADVPINSTQKMIENAPDAQAKGYKKTILLFFFKIDKILLLLSFGLLNILPEKIQILTSYSLLLATAIVLIFNKSLTTFYAFLNEAICSTLYMVLEIDTPINKNHSTLEV